AVGLLSCNPQGCHAVLEYARSHDQYAIDNKRLLVPKLHLLPDNLGKKGGASRSLHTAHCTKEDYAIPNYRARHRNTFFDLVESSEKSNVNILTNRRWIPPSHQYKMKLR